MRQPVGEIQLRVMAGRAGDRIVERKSFVEEELAAQGHGSGCGRVIQGNGDDGKPERWARKLQRLIHRLNPAERHKARVTAFFDSTRTQQDSNAKCKDAYQVRIPNSRTCEEIVQYSTNAQIVSPVAQITY